LGALYRIRQFALALRAPFSPDGADHLDDHLEAPQVELFRQMSPMDQRHCLAVSLALRADGQTNRSLQRAALLHDVGKTVGPVGVWHRVAAVLARALVPGTRLPSHAQPGTLLYPLYVHREHATLGAEMARQAGCGPEVVWLIAHHEDEAGPVGEDTTRNELLAALQAADRVN
jgi:putative nucleotidyltransferase with HDIG domain